MTPISARILGTGRALPDRVLTNDDLSKKVETSDAWINERTGIRERRILEEGLSTSDLAARAGLAAAQAAEIDPSQIDCIIVATVTPDQPMPAVAVTVQQKLGIKTNVPAFDISAACAGFLYGLSVADAFVRGGNFKRVLVVGVEILSRIVDWTDRNTCVLFGDGAGAAIIGPAQGDERGIISTHLFADGSQAGALNIPAGGSIEPTTSASVEARHHFVKMNGKVIFTHAVKNLSRAAQIALEHNHLQPSDISWVVAHQANLRILEAVSARVGIPLERFYLNIQKYGNTSSASIPIALDEAVRSGKIKRGDRLLLAALGAGLSWGSAVVRY